MAKRAGVVAREVSAAIWLAFAAVAAVACEGTADPGVDAVADAAPPSRDAGATTDGHATFDAAVDAGEDDPVPTSPDCLHYCETIEQVCVGEMKQYGSRNACLRACAFFPLGQPGDATGNSRICRIRHVDAAVVAPDQRRGHCLHAGPYGYGGCGEPCEAVCVLSLAWCTSGPGPAPFKTEAECVAACAAFQPASPEPMPGIPQYSAAGPTSGDSVDCRQYHLTTALDSKAARDTHCPSVGVTSAACR